MKRWATGLLVAGVVTTIVPTTAIADTETARGQCERNEGRPASVALHLSPTAISTGAGLPGQPLQAEIQPGSVVRVTATGRISYGGVFNWRGTWDPNGNGQPAPTEPEWPWPAWPFPSGPDAALVGSWNQNGVNMRIGVDSQCMVVPAVTAPRRPSGLLLRANDNYLGDNGDVGYDILVRVWRP